MKSARNGHTYYVMLGYLISQFIVLRLSLGLYIDSAMNVMAIPTQMHIWVCSILVLMNKSKTKHASPFIFTIEGRVCVIATDINPWTEWGAIETTTMENASCHLEENTSFFSLTYHTLSIGWIPISGLSLNFAMLWLSVISFIYSWLSCDACLLGVFGLFFSFMNNY